MKDRFAFWICSVEDGTEHCGGLLSLLLDVMGAVSPLSSWAVLGEKRGIQSRQIILGFFYYLKCFIVVSFNGEPKSFLMDTSWNLSLSQGDVNQKSNKSGYFFEKTFIYLRHFTWIMFSHEFEGCGIILTFVFVNCEKLLQKDAWI